MSKYEFKQLVVIITFSIINICIAYFITATFGIQNIILYQSYTAMQYTITYEIIIFMALSFIESLIYQYKYEM